jgi:uncharacterized membrane-anchored protein YhcB (DUF1043 family)
MTILYIIIIVLVFIIGFLIGRKNNITIHNENDIERGMELQRRNDEYRKYICSKYYDTIPPRSEVQEGYRKIRKEVLGHY